MIIKLGGREEHEKDCEYAPVQCPNSSNCSVVLKKDLTEHLLNCKHVRCPHHRYKSVPHMYHTVEPQYDTILGPEGVRYTESSSFPMDDSYCCIVYNDTHGHFSSFWGFV